MDDQRNSGGGGGEPPLPAEAQLRIGIKLRAMYRDIVSEPVPDRFLSLLEQLNSDPIVPGAKSRTDSRDDH